jgi:hypothetical protein
MTYKIVGVTYLPLLLYGGDGVFERGQITADTRISTVVSNSLLCMDWPIVGFARM